MSKCGKNKCSNCASTKKSCTTCKVKPQWRYCGEDIECPDIKKGDSLPEIIQKLSEKACEGGEGGSYTFEDNNACNNGGFLIKDENSNIVFTQCYPEETSNNTFEEDTNCANGGFRVLDEVGSVIFSQCYPETGGGECCLPKGVYYYESRSHMIVTTDELNNNVSGNYVTDQGYTITAADGAGKYEIYFLGSVAFNDDDIPISWIGVHIDGVPVDNLIHNYVATGLQDRFEYPYPIFQSEIVANIGERIGFYVKFNPVPTPTFLTPLPVAQHYKWKLTKIED